MTQQSTETTQLIPLAQLCSSPDNVRRTAKRTGMDELKASIIAHGLLQNLVVTDNGDGHYSVIAGGRRFTALLELTEEGKLPDDFPVPCQVADAQHARELSLAENVARVAMHPADEFEAFAELIESGSTATDVAERFGVTEKHVLQRLKLSRVAPELIVEYREGNLDLACLMAFTVTHDQERQREVYRTASGWQRESANWIRRCLTETSVDGDNKLAKFVGLDVYQAAGGRVRTDLFGDEVYLDDPDLLNRLVGSKLDTIKHQLLIDGWSWVEVNVDQDWNFIGQCSRKRPEPVDPPAELVAEEEEAKKELDAAEHALSQIEEDSGDYEEAEERRDAAWNKLDALRERLCQCVRFTPEQMRSSGCYVTVNHHGQPHVEKGLVLKKDEKKAAKEEKKTATPGAEEPDISNALKQDLAVYRLQVAQLALSRNYEVVFDLLAFRAADEALGNHTAFDGPSVRFEPNYRRPSVEDGTPADEKFEEVFTKLPRKWLKPESEAERFKLFQGLTLDEKFSILAYCVANTLRPCLAPTDASDLTAYDVALSQTCVNVAEHWRPTKENYLSRLTREQLLSLGEEVINQEWAEENRNSKKGQLVERLAGVFEDGLENARGWLPPGMAFELPEAKPKKVRKGKKAA